MSAFNKKTKSKFSIENKDEFMKSNSIFDNEEMAEENEVAMSENYYLYEDKIKSAVDKFDEKVSKKSLQDELVNMEVAKMQTEMRKHFYATKIIEKPVKNKVNNVFKDEDNRVVVDDWRAFSWGFEKKGLLSIEDFKTHKVLSVDELEKNIDLFINKASVLLNILSSSARVHLDVDDISHDNFTSKIENSIKMIVDYLFLTKVDSDSKERVYLYFNKKIDGIYDYLKNDGGYRYDGFEYNIKNALIGSFKSFYTKVLPFLMEKPIGRLYSSYKTLGKFNVRFWEQNEWRTFAININNEIKENEARMKTFLTEDFSDFVLNGITFFIDVSSTELSLLLKDINVLKITCGTRMFRKIFGGTSNNPIDMIELVHFTKILLSSNIWELDDVDGYWVEYLSANPNVLKTTKGLNYIHREGFFKCVKSTELFWLVFFNALCDFETNLSRSSVAEDKIQEFFYSFSLLSDVSENWRIPEKYVVDINGNNNIIKKMVLFTEKNKLSFDFIKDKLLNLVRHNHPILLSGSFVYDDKRITLQEYFKSNLTDTDFNLFFPKEVFKKKWLFFGSTKVETVTPKDNFVYENKQSMRIRFKPVVAPVSVNEVAAIYSLREQSDILKSWNIHGLNFSEDIFSALEALATKVSDARAFLENYPVYCEEAEFIRGRIDYYVIELLVGYSNDFKKQEAMRKISSISLSIDLEKELIKNLGVLQNQIQVSIDKIVRETQEHLSFEVKKMDVFLGYRFPEAVSTRGTNQVDEEDLFFNFKR